MTTHFPDTFANYTTDTLCEAVAYWPESDRFQAARRAELTKRGGQKICQEALEKVERRKLETEIRLQAERQRRSEMRRRVEARRQAEIRRQLEAQRQADARRQAEAQRQAEARRQAEAKRQADAQRQAEAKRKADAAKKSKLYRVGSGSGFSISRNGLIVTNHHVIDG